MHTIKFRGQILNQNRSPHLPRSERIPYKAWANSQLSIAKYYGGIKINGKSYVLDYDNCPTTGEGENMKYFPDLVLLSSIPKNKAAISNKEKSKKPINLLSLFPIPTE